MRLPRAAFLVLVLGACAPHREVQPPHEAGPPAISDARIEPPIAPRLEPGSAPAVLSPAPSPKVAEAAPKVAPECHGADLDIDALLARGACKAEGAVVPPPPP